MLKILPKKLGFILSCFIILAQFQKASQFMTVVNSGGLSVRKVILSKKIILFFKTIPSFFLQQAIQTGDLCRFTRRKIKAFIFMTNLSSKTLIASIFDMPTSVLKPKQIVISGQENQLFSFILLRVKSYITTTKKCVSNCYF